ncbi:hypothetical protein GF386_01095 [Candidatus Pacearchaeota archaeon]|nr:hypothetical protein [Candidatus Pacearchaeota archaeon]MBD3282828.1 hypothetical protein [Candidatus Pacearchaeota archaeon]
MQEIYIENLKKVLGNKNKLEKELDIKIKNKGKLVLVEGLTEKEFIAIKILEAIDLNFSIDDALKLKKEEIIMQILNIKKITKRHDLERIRARIIGTHGKTLKTLTDLTKCSISLKDNKIGIIGDCEEIEDAIQAVKSLIQGSKQGNVYARAEKQRKRKKLRKDEPIKNELKNK